MLSSKMDGRITHDPFHLQFGGSNMFVDLGAEQLVSAEKEGRRIAVEIKGFTEAAEMTELERAVGQFTVYRLVLEERAPDYILYLAVPEDVVKDTFEQPLGQLLVKNAYLRVFGFNPDEETITRWID